MLTKLINTTWGEICVSEWISVSYYVLSEEWEFLKSASEICVKRISVNQGIGVFQKS